ncbi:MAG: hypothetical protein ACKVU1_03340 [bacterium]
MSHLSDTELARIAAGIEGVALTEGSERHLEECKDCAYRLAARVRAMGEDEHSTAVDNSGAPPPSPQAVAQLRSAFAVASAKYGWGRPRILALIPMRAQYELPGTTGEAHSVIPAAARPAGELPSFRTEDDQAVVRFDAATANRPTRAQLLADIAWFGAGATLHFENPALAFPFDANGGADLPGIAATDVRVGNMRVERDIGEGEHK